jgi:hypothetical protein
MSQANVEIVRSVYETFAQRGDRRIRQDAMADLWHEDARFVSLPARRRSA